MSRTAFSGHTYISKDDFDVFYAPIVEECISRGDSFVLGCADGVDRMVFDLVYDRWCEVTLYNKGIRPDWVPKNIVCDVSATSWTGRDDLILANANRLVAFVANTKMGLGSGTARNIVAFSGRDVSDFYSFTRNDDTTIEAILERYPPLRDVLMIRH